MTTPPWPTVTELRESIRKQLRESPQLVDTLVEVVVQALVKSHGIPLGPIRPSFLATKLGSAYTFRTWDDGSFVIYRKAWFGWPEHAKHRVVEYAAPAGCWYRWTDDSHVDDLLADLGVDLAAIQIHPGSILRRRQPP
jgi:hypothetical protein